MSTPKRKAQTIGRSICHQDFYGYLGAAIKLVGAKPIHSSPVDKQSPKLSLICHKLVIAKISLRERRARDRLTVTGTSEESEKDDINYLKLVIKESISILNSGQNSNDLSPTTGYISSI
ncbi:unnamed protein product [Gordionus sp. m RMFG-2023]